MRKSLVVSALLLSSMAILSSMAAAMAATNKTVLDVDGNKLQTKTNYYVLPVIRGRGGRLALGLRNKTCPFFVVQENFEVSNGIPLKFLPTDSNMKVVHLSVDMNIVFSSATICVQSTAWRVGDIDGLTGKRYVKTAGVTGNPGLGTVSNWFKIERYRDDYKLVFCPGVCMFCKVVCGDLGVFFEDGKRWLGLSDVPLAVMFKKA
ncbi:Proteinase inhibitor I3 [Macleaya cordata]|uniref:Proteinase inhibitor I3 n=1 Tax=Macleaya cordata TaxID=56857 RepID=A0A200Q524_MACCD|nr:Proteinase inhibitor I3 [Macleaya cordata]